MLLLLGAPQTGTACQQKVELTGRTMGPIPYKVLVSTDDVRPERLKQIQETVQKSLARVNELMSTYQPDSDISKFNRSESTDWFDVDPETALVVKRALTISEQTNGAFDPTVGPLVKLWNFGPGKKEEATLPAEKEIAKRLESVGADKLDVRTDPPALKKSVAELEVDLSAIAKGYAVDRVCRSLSEIGLKDCMVSVGGEVMTVGERAGGGKWRVAIEKPTQSKFAAEGEEILRVVELSGEAVATSGDYRNFFEIDGEKYSHTIDAKTGHPVKHSMATASVVAKDCMTADALATAVMVMGKEKGQQLSEQLKFALLTVEREGEENVIESSDDYPKEFRDSDPSDEGEKGDSSEPKKSSILLTFVFTFGIFALAILGMAVGAILNNKPVTGSCGGLAAMTNEDGEEVCGICSKPTVDCDQPIPQPEAAS